MRFAIIGGSGVYAIDGLELEPETINNRYGKVQVYRGACDSDELVFLPRHGTQHDIPPHRINYRANLKALSQLGVERIMATFTVGSVNPNLPPGALIAPDQFIDFTHGRDSTFFDGGVEGVAHTEITFPYCPALRDRLLTLAPKHKMAVHPRATYCCFNGPRLETAAEIKMVAVLGGDIVGMTGCPEVQLARELGMHYAAVAVSINWAAGIQGAIKMERQLLDESRRSLLNLCVETLRGNLAEACTCESSVMMKHPPEENDEPVQ